MLVYAFSSWDEYCLPIIKYAKEHKLKILCLGQELKWADKSVENATFEEWITDGDRDQAVILAITKLPKLKEV